MVVVVHYERTSAGFYFQMLTNNYNVINWRIKIHECGYNNHEPLDRWMWWIIK